MALALTKRALAASSTNTLAQQLDLERDLQRLAGASPDAAEGVRAFLEKRQPKFTGRKRMTRDAAEIARGERARPCGRRTRRAARSA